MVGVPKGSVLYPLLFSIHRNDSLPSVHETDICNYSDDSTIYARDKDQIVLVHRWRMIQVQSFNGLLMTLCNSIQISVI